MAAEQRQRPRGQGGHAALALGVLLGSPRVSGVARAESSDRCQRNVACKVHSDKGVSLSERKAYAEALAEFWRRTRPSQCRAFCSTSVAACIALIGRKRRSTTTRATVAKSTRWMPRPSRRCAAMSSMR